MTLRRRLRLVPVAATAWVVAAVAATVPETSGPVAVALWTVTALGVITIGVRRSDRFSRRSTRVTVLLVTVAACAGAATASAVALAQPARVSAEALQVEGGRAVTVHAMIVGKVESWGSDRRAFDAWASRIDVGREVHPVAVPISVLVPRVEAGDGALDVGALVEVSGTLTRTDPGDRSVWEVQATRGVRVVSPPHGALAAASDLRRGLVRAVAGLPEPGAGLLPGLAVGDTSAVDETLDDEMKAASLSHLTAVSGANCALVVGIAFGAAAMSGARRGVRVAAGIAALAGFVVLVTPEPSVVRAAAMAAIAMTAVLLGRTGAGLSVLCVAVTVILIGDPWLAGSLGFALSTAATASLLLFARPLAGGLSRVLPRPLALALSVPLAAQLACGPLLVLITPVTPLYGVAANLLAAPAAPAATVLGLAACLSAPFPLLQSGLTAIAWVPAAWIAGTAETFAGLPGNAVPWIGGWWGVAGLAALGVAIGIVVVGVRADVWRWRRWMHAAATALVAVVVGAASGGALLGGVAASWTVPPEWAVAACDIGQGDAVLLRSEGRVALVDTGPDAEALSWCLTRLGVHRIDLLVLTHFDLDHAGGASAVRGRVTDVLHGPPAEAADAALLRDFANAGAEIVDATAGLSGDLGAARWRVLWPREGSRAFPPGNDAGVVIDVRGGGVPSAVLLADLSGAAQRALVAGGMLQPPYDLVKVAHHGSADQHPALYALLRASVAVISVGAGNTYGHPRDELLSVLAATGAVLARTDSDGLVAIWTTGDRLSVWRERAPATAEARAPPLLGDRSVSGAQ